ncbi:MAG: glycosyltransferase family 2 protein [Planctomycetes bacterium]|nr:glycosyltransferase family 2 protein [Planctomycetota bacterium]MCB9885510.1 glycosyltransferase family 2 protein [Planctomycetota bacterium]
MPSRTALVIPAYCEAGRVGDVVRQALQLDRELRLGLEVVVVDDGSDDATAQEARVAGATVVSHPYNLGYGVSLHTGYCYAFRNGFDRVLQMDADGQHEAAMLPNLIAALDDGADVVLGSRYLEGEPPASTLSRRVGTALFAWIATRFTGMRITDPTSGFQGLSGRALGRLVSDGFPEDYPDTDVLIEHARSGMKLVEVPVRMHSRRGGLSMHRGARIAYYGYKMLLTLLLLPVRRPSPLRQRDTVARTT